MVLAADVALIGGLGLAVRANDWVIVNFPWWSWLVFATPPFLSSSSCCCRCRSPRSARLAA